MPWFLSLVPVMFGGDLAHFVPLLQTRKARCLRHREWRRTRHPKMGAAERRWLTRLLGTS